MCEYIADFILLNEIQHLENETFYSRGFFWTVARHMKYTPMVIFFIHDHFLKGCGGGGGFMDYLYLSRSARIDSRRRRGFFVSQILCQIKKKRPPYLRCYARLGLPYISDVMPDKEEPLYLRCYETFVSQMLCQMLPYSYLRC